MKNENEYCVMYDGMYVWEEYEGNDLEEALKTFTNMIRNGEPTRFFINDKEVKYYE